MIKNLFVLVAAFAMVLGMVGVSNAGPLPSNCTKVKGTVTCTTYEPSPAKNQAGLGTTSVEETQGNTTNKSPAPKNLKSDTSCKPAKSKGTPCA